MGRGAEGPAVNAAAISKDKSPQKAILIDGQLYDATNFNHPGGSIIKFLCTPGTDDCVDATNAFREFHFRQKDKAEKYLKSLPKITTPYKFRYDEKEVKRREALSRDFQKLREELKDEGFFDSSPVEIIYRSLEIVALFVFSFYLLAASNPLLIAVGVLVNGIAQGRCGWWMHECGHMSATGIPKIDIRMQELVYGLGCGMSGGWWRSQHNRHHATPQKLKHDVDLDTLPLVAFHESIAHKVKPGSLMAKWLALQGYLFAPFSCFAVGFFWTLFLHPRHIMRKNLKMEAVWIALRYIGWAALMTSMGYSVSNAAKMYALCFGWGCTYIFVNFAVSHTHLDVSQPDDYLHWAEYSSDHTTNVSCDSWLVTWWMANLNFQIEHHMFPQMPQKNHPRVSPRVRALFEKHGLRYDERPYLTALADTFNNLHNVGHNAGKGKTE